MRNELQFFATLPPSIIYLHVKVWQLGQKYRGMSGLLGKKLADQALLAAGNADMDDGAEEAVAERQYHSIISCFWISTRALLMYRRLFR